MRINISDAQAKQSLPLNQRSHLLVAGKRRPQANLLVRTAIPRGCGCVPKRPHQSRKDASAPVDCSRNLQAVGRKPGCDRSKLSYQPGSCRIVTPPRPERCIGVATPQPRQPAGRLAFDKPLQRQPHKCDFSSIPVYLCALATRSSSRVMVVRMTGSPDTSQLASLDVDYNAATRPGDNPL